MRIEYYETQRSIPVIITIKFDNKPAQTLNNLAGIEMTKFLQDPFQETIIL